MCLWIGAAPAQAAAPDTAARVIPAETRAWQTGALRADRLEHASLAWTLGLGAGIASRDARVAAGTPAVLGLIKECLDRRRTGFDPIDLLADGLGAAAAAWWIARRY